MVGLAGIFMLTGAPICEDDVRAAFRVRDASAAAGGAAAGIVRHGSALLIGRGSGAPAVGIAVPAEPDRFSAVFAGRMDNADALREQLVALGAPGAMENDAAILREAYRVWGAGAAVRIEGAFAFAIHDAEAKTLFCGRDRFGIEPFHFALSRDRLVFASDLSAIVHWPSVRRTADHDALAHYLAFGFFSPSHAPLTGVQRLAPAHTMRAEHLRTLRCETYWTLPILSKKRGASPSRPTPDEAAAELRGRLDEILGRTLGRSTCIGLVLPGDLASAALAEAAMRAAARDGGPEVHTFTIRPNDAGAAIASKSSRDHRIALDESSATAALSLIERSGEPFADPEALAAHALLAAADGHVPLCLTAAGGPELLLEHGRYNALATALGRHRDTRVQPAPRQGFHATMPFVRDLYGDLVCLSSDVQRLAMSGPALVGSLLLSPVDDLGSSLERANEDGVVDLASRIDIAHGAPRMLAPLHIARHMQGLDLRAPMLDPGFATWCADLSQTTRLADATGQSGSSGLSRRATTATPPAPYLGASSRAALDHWFRTSLHEQLEDTIASAAFRDRGLFRMSWVERLVRDHIDGTRANGALLWALLCLETWFLTFVDRIPEVIGKPALALTIDTEAAV